MKYILNVILKTNQLLFVNSVRNKIIVFCLNFMLEHVFVFVSVRLTMFLLRDS